MTPVCACGQPSPDAVLCRACTRDLARALLTAASIAADLDDAAARLLRRGGGTGGGPSSPEPPLPVDLIASNAASELRTELRRAVSVIMLAHPQYPCVDPGQLIIVASRWLSIRLGAVRQHPDAAQILDGIRRAVAGAVRAVDRLPERTPAGTCEACGAQLLAELGADEVTCACGILATGLNEKRRERAAAADVLGTATEVSGALERIGIRVSASTIRAWASRKRLTARPGSSPQRPVYALSEVLGLVAERDSRR